MSYEVSDHRFVLILSHQFVEATDIADFVSSRGLGQVLVESDLHRGLDVMRTAQVGVSHAFINMPSNVLLDELIDALILQQARIVMIDSSKTSRATAASISHISRPFTDTDLDGAITHISTST